VAFRDATDFPDSLFGPVEHLELATQAAYLAAEMGRLDLGSFRGESELKTTMGWNQAFGLWPAPPPVGWAA
jgi:hypothetical protein